MGAADGDQLLVLGAEALVARLAGSGGDAAIPPGHVAAVVRPVPAGAADLLAVIDHRDAARGQLQGRRQAEQVLVAVELEEGSRGVVGGEIGGEQVPGADLLARLEVAVEGHRPPAALHPAERVPLEGEVEAGVHLVVHEPGVEHLGVASPDLADQEEARADLRAAAPPVLLPEVVLHVLDRVEPEAVHPELLGPAELRLEQVVGHLGQLGLEVREPGDAGGQVVLAAGAQGLGAEPAAGLRILGEVGVVARVVVDHVEQHLDAAGVGLVHQGLQLRLGAEAGVERVEVVRPVAVITPVREAGAGDRARDVLDHRGDPERRDSEVRDLVEMGGQPLVVAAVEGPLGPDVDVPVVAGVAVGEAVGDDEVEDGVAPALLGDDRDTGRGGRRRRGARRLRGRGAAAGEERAQEHGDARRYHRGARAAEGATRFLPERSQRHLPPGQVVGRAMSKILQGCGADSRKR